MSKINLKTSVALLSVISNTMLVAAKLAIGFAIGSVSVISEAIHSGVDLLAAVIALFAVHKSDQPADREHTFGHGKYENLSGTIEALLIFGAAGWIIFEAIHKLITPKAMDSAFWGVVVMLVSSLVNVGVSHLLFTVGNKTDSIALKADAWHLRTDVYTTAGVMVGLLIIWAGKKIFPNLNLEWLDPVAAILVALLIVRAAYELSRQAIADLLDVSLPVEESDWIEEQIRRFQPRILGFHNFRSRKSGPTRFIEFHITVNPDMSVHDAHELNDTLVAAIKNRFHDSKVMVHIEPCKMNCDGSCDPKCREKCFKNASS
jgi:cation diffusion facilitator family transporter